MSIILQQHLITIPALTDSAPVYFTITDDSIVEHLESILFVFALQLLPNDSVGTDSIFTLSIIDNELYGHIFISDAHGYHLGNAIFL
jgi:hypothetical protein